MNVTGSRIASGFGWVALSNYGNRVLGFVTTLVLAKFLAPDDFGLVAIASMLIEMLRIFKDMGLSQALIYTKDDIRRSANTAFWLMLAVNVALFSIATMASPFAAKFYSNGLVTPVIILMSSNMVWNSLRAVPTALIRKEIDFKKLVIPDIVPVALASAVSIVMAFKGCGVWSLVVRSLIWNIGGMLLIWKFTWFRPNFAFDMAVARDLWRYGRYIVGASVVLVILYNVDKFYISKFSGVAALGIYELAMRLSNLPVSELSHLIGSVMFPVLSKMNEDREGMKRIFLKTLRYNNMISIPMAVGIATYGPSLIDTIYGERWMPMALPLRVLAFYAFFRSMSTIIHDAFKAAGHPYLTQRFALIRLVLIGTIGIPALMWKGIMGICILVLSTYLVTFVLEGLALRGSLSIRLREVLGSCLMPSLICLPIIVGGYWFLETAVESLTLTWLVIGVALTVFFYFLCVSLFDKVIVTEVRSTIFSRGRKAAPDAYSETRDVSPV